MLAGPLIAAAELAELLGSDDQPVVLDIRWDPVEGPDRDGYVEGHIPGAVFIDLDEQLADPPSERGRHPLPSAERFEAGMRAAGVSRARPVVVYDQGGSMWAARAWWMLRYFGQAEVAVVDGGLAAWVAAGYRVERGAAAVEPGDFVARPGGMPTAALGEVEATAADGVLIDARAAKRFSGEHEPIDPVAGHIPGARNRPTAKNLDERGRFRASPELRQAFERLGARDAAPVAAYCGSGVSAAHTVLALELAGYRAALYPGSWSEWIADPERPVARGA